MQNTHIFFPEEIYTDHLQVISGIKFTPREVDIIACIMSGKNPQAIANFLSSTNRPIEMQTVSTHISNIRRKIDGNARGSIIDFIENSDKHKIVHNYYLSLLIQKEFNKSLREIIPILTSHIESFAILSYKEGSNNVSAKKESQSVQSHIEEHEQINSIVLSTYLQNHLKLLTKIWKVLFKFTNSLSRIVKISYLTIKLQEILVWARL